MKDEDMTLADAVDLVCEYLPEDWEVLVKLSLGCRSVDLIGPDGEAVELSLDDSIFARMILDAINHARNADGLGSVGWKGEPIPPGTEDDYLSA